MNDIKITIPPLTFVKFFLRGINNFSPMREIQKRAKSTLVNERVGFRTSDDIVVYFEKISLFECVVLTAYRVGKDKETVSYRAVALMGILLKKLQ